MLSAHLADYFSAIPTASIDLGKHYVSTLILQTIHLADYLALYYPPPSATHTLKTPSNASERRSLRELRNQLQRCVQQEVPVLRAHLVDAVATRDVAADGVRRLWPVTEAAIRSARGT